MVYHLLTERTQIDISGGYQLPFFPAKPMLTMFISRLEESLMGIEVASTSLNRQMLNFPSAVRQAARIKVINGGRKGAAMATDFSAVCPLI